MVRLNPRGLLVLCSLHKVGIILSLKLVQLYQSTKTWGLKFLMYFYILLKKVPIIALQSR